MVDLCLARLGKTIKGGCMNIEKIWKRIEMLEKKAKAKYIDQIPWRFIVECLSEDEQREYKKLCKKVGIRVFWD